jgi:DNA helicase-2/ATP-dependent DNA helicase PcrA
LDGTVECEARFENIEELKNLAGNFLENRVDDSDGDQLTAFLERVALYQESEILNKEQQAVTLMTLHAAKGLEFADVFIIGLEEGIFPHSRSLSEIDQLEEERRLCYVGMTRAMKRLYLIYARQRMFHGNLSTSLPSRFISEIPEEFIDQI